MKFNKDRSQKWALAVRQVNSVLGCLKRSMAGRLREEIVPHCLPLVGPHTRIASSVGLSPYIQIQDRHQ